MDTASQNAMDFLLSLQQRREQLVKLWNVLLVRGSRPQNPYLKLSSSPFRIHEAEHLRIFAGSIAMGVIVYGTDNKEYDLGIDVLWTETGWTITTEVWIENEDGGQTLLDRLPERISLGLPDCLKQMQDAVADLFHFQTLVPGKEQ